MQTLRITSSTPDLPEEAIVCHDVRNPAERNQILVRKGNRLQREDFASLLARGVDELHLAVAEPGDLDEDAAALRLATAVLGSGVEAGEPHFGQSNLVATTRGMLRIDRSRLEQVNAEAGVLVLTAEADRPVDVETTLGVVKCAPLFLSERTLSAVEGVGPIVSLEPFSPMRMAFVAPTDRLRGGAFDRARGALTDAVGWYGSTLDPFVGAEATVASMAAAYRWVADAGADLIFAAGASGTDPLDVVFDGLRQAGGEVIQYGIPAEPGTACWIGELDAVPVLGLASCELFGQPGALDLLLPRLFTGERLSGRLLRELAYGGLLLGPSRIVPYHTARGA